MTAVCIAYQVIQATMTESSLGTAANVPKPAGDVGDGQPMVTVTDRDSSLLGLIQDKEVIRNG
jgi:hypothetical protein